MLIFLNSPAQSIADKHASIGAAGLILSWLKLGLQALRINSIAVRRCFPSELHIARIVSKTETDLHFGVVLIFLNSPAQSIADKHASIRAAGLILSLLKLGLQALRISSKAVRGHFLSGLL